MKDTDTKLHFAIQEIQLQESAEGLAEITGWCFHEDGEGEVKGVRAKIGGDVYVAKRKHRSPKLLELYPALLYVETAGFRLKLPLKEQKNSAAFEWKNKAGKWLALTTVNFSPSTDKFRQPPENLYWPKYPLNRLNGQSSSTSEVVGVGQPFGKIAVQLHAYYLDTMDVIMRYLHTIPSEFDLLVSTDTDEKADAIRAMMAAELPHCRVIAKLTRNRGRDIAPFIIHFGKDLLQYDYALHIHTKKCAGREALGAEWLSHNLDHLLHDRAYVKTVLEIMHQQPRCGIVIPEPWGEVRGHMHWGLNREYAEQLFDRIKIPRLFLHTQPLHFPAGTMFWFKPAALEPLLSSDLSMDDFMDEPIPDDGTLAHAIERCILYIATYMGYCSVTVHPKTIGALVEGPTVEA